MKKFVLCCLLLAVSAAGFSQASSWWRIPAVGAGPGAYGSYWLSDIYFFNPNGYTITVEVVLIYATGSYGGLTVQVPAWDSATIEDVGYEFSLQGAAALQLQGQGGAEFYVMSRTYNLETDGDTLGQDVPGQDWCAGQNPAGPDEALLFLGIQYDSQFRTNFGFMGDSTPADLQVDVYDGDGNFVVTVPVHINPWSSVTFSLGSYTNATIFNGYAVAFLMSTAQTCVNGYASVVDNGTQDGTYIGGQYITVPTR
jgi:hypothetical protein